MIKTIIVANRAVFANYNSNSSAAQPKIKDCKRMLTKNTLNNKHKQQKIPEPRNNTYNLP